MFTPHDTIVAIATPPGRGGLGVVRVSGQDAHRIALQLIGRGRPLAPRRATFARVMGASGVADQVVVTFFAAPRSYTGEDVVELSAHGSPVVLRSLVRQAIIAGCRLAEPGEFTFRAYLSGRIDLVQAEAVRDLIEAVTPLQARAAFDQLEGTLTTAITTVDAHLFDLTAKLEASIDFPDEGYHFIQPADVVVELEALATELAALLDTAGRGRMIREGLQVTIAGRPNVGKSSLFNRLAGSERAIVAARPGTTRDLLTEAVDIDGVPMTIVDTAGLRSDATDDVEAEGIARAVAAQTTATVLLLVVDRSAPLLAEDRRLLEAARGRRHVVAANKSDLPAAWEVSEASEAGVVLTEVSAATGAGIAGLRQALLEAAAGEAAQRDIPAVTNLRHAELLRAAGAAVLRAAEAARTCASEEFVLADLLEARHALEEVTGARSADDLLTEIFARFCIGK